MCVQFSALRCPPIGLSPCRVVVAAREAARRDLAGAFEHDVGRVHDEQHLAPGGQRLQDLLEPRARHDRAVLGGKRPHHLERADPVVARDLLENAVGVLREPLGQGRRRRAVSLMPPPSFGGDAAHGAVGRHLLQHVEALELGMAERRRLAVRCRRARAPCGRPPTWSSPRSRRGCATRCARNRARGPRAPAPCSRWKATKPGSSCR